LRPDFDTAPPAPAARPLPMTPRQAARARRVLAAGSSARVLAALDAGDPLEIGQRVRLCLRRGAWLVDPEALRRSALARIALEAGGWSGRPPLEVWLDDHIEAALAEHLEREPYARFHRLPHDVRDVFCRALLDGEDPEDLARRRCGDLSRFGRSLLLALEALSGAEPQDPRKTVPLPVTHPEAVRLQGADPS
jgi:hypothetical protein